MLWQPKFLGFHSVLCPVLDVHRSRTLNHVSAFSSREVVLGAWQCRADVAVAKRCGGVWDGVQLSSVVELLCAVEKMF